MTGAAARRRLIPFSFSRTLRICGVLLLAGASYAPLSVAAQAVPAGNAASCANFGNAFDDGKDILALTNYQTALRQLIAREDFKQLDCIADAARSSKARFAGGMWQLHNFYTGTSSIQGHATEEDWRARIEHVQHWVTANPNSITARVTLAKTYINFAWDARGNGGSDTVTDNGWKLFQQRAEQARKILDDAASLSTKCPEWYMAMQQVARSEGWDLNRSTELFKQAVAFAPDYFYYYRMQATYLLPKWEGQEGDSSKFAEENANRVGGAKGDVLYFQIASDIVCACDEPEFTRMSWPRLEAGYAELEKEYGPSMTNLNLLALMAAKNNDSVTADAAFKRLGDNYDESKWMTKDYFNQMKGWATQFAPLEARSRVMMQEATANAVSPAGPPYQKNVEQSLAKMVQQCAASTADHAPFEFMVQISAEGIAKDGWMGHPTVIGNCVLKQIYDSSVKKEAMFPAPPHADYWMKLVLDPAVSVAIK